MYRESAIVVVLVTAMTAAGASALDARSDEILAGARSYVARRSYPAHLEYRVVVTLTRDDGHATSRTYDSAFDGTTAVVYAHAISREEAAHPFVPHGINVAVQFGASTATGSTETAIPLNRPADDADVLGVPMLSPTFAFGLGRQSPSTADRSELPIIGRVATSGRDYEVSYLGDQDVDGEQCAHVQLVPTHNPERLRLRELWVAADGAPLRAVTHGNFTARPWDRIDWVVTFRRDGSALYLDTESTQQSVRVDRYRRGRVSISFRDVAPSEFQRRFLVSLQPRNAVREP